jgi:hypothetical protein
MSTPSDTGSRRKSASAEEFLATRQFESDFSVFGEVEFDEIDDPELEVEMGFLADRVRAARSFGA